LGLYCFLCEATVLHRFSALRDHQDVAFPTVDVFNFVVRRSVFETDLLAFSESAKQEDQNA